MSAQSDRRSPTSSVNWLQLLVALACAAAAIGAAALAGVTPGMLIAALPAT